MDGAHYITGRQSEAGRVSIVLRCVWVILVRKWEGYSGLPLSMNVGASK